MPRAQSANPVTQSLPHALTASLACLIAAPIHAAEPPSAETPIVLHLTGAPTANVWLIKANDSISVKDGKVTGDEACLKATSNPDGTVRFTLPPPDAARPYLLFALSENGYAFAKPGETQLRIQPWTKITGTAHVGKTPEAGRKIVGWFNFPESPDQGEPYVYFCSLAQTDTQGRYVLDGAPALPGYVALANSRVSLPLWEVPASSDSIRPLDLGSIGPRAKARILLPPGITSWTDIELDDGDTVYKNTNDPALKPLRPPAGVIAQGIAAEAQWARQYAASDEAKQRQKLLEESSALSRQTMFPIASGPEGLVTVPYGIPPGDYSFGGRIYRKVTDAGKRRYILIGTYHKNFTVPPNDPRNIIDLGDIHPKPAADTVVGDPVPPLILPNLRGGELDLASFRGKYVLLDFWATWCGPCVAEMPNLKAAYDRFHPTGNVEFVSVSFDDTPDKPIDFVAKNDIAWHQTIAGNWGDRSPEIKAMIDRFGIDGIPQIMLIDPAGKVVAKGLREEAIPQALQSALGPAPLSASPTTQATK